MSEALAKNILNGKMYCISYKSLHHVFLSCTAIISELLFDGLLKIIFETKGPSRPIHSVPNRRMKYEHNVTQF